MKKVIITGGTGFIGRHLVKKMLADKQYFIVIIANRLTADTELYKSMNLRFHTADIRERETISNIFLDEKAESCIHLAAKISVADSIKKPAETMEINVNGTVNVLDACQNSGVKNFVFASSAAIYGNVKRLPVSEDQDLRPLSPYGLSKMLAERHVISYKKLKKIKNAISLRIFNVYGKGQTSEQDVITRFAKRLSTGLPPAIFGNGIQTRDFISIADVTDAFLLSIRSMEESEYNFGDNNSKISLPLAYNIGTGTPTSIKELAERMISILGLNLQPVYKKSKEGDKGILHSYADMTRTKKLLHFVPKKGLEAGLKDMLRIID